MASRVASCVEQTPIGRRLHRNRRAGSGAAHGIATLLRSTDCADNGRPSGRHSFEVCRDDTALPALDQVRWDAAHG